jgi:hypothetical protein
MAQRFFLRLRQIFVQLSDPKYLSLILGTTMVAFAEPTKKLSMHSAHAYTQNRNSCTTIGYFSLSLSYLQAR